MSGEELAAPLGALPPVRIHCAQLVEGALRAALTGEKQAAPSDGAESLLGKMTGSARSGKIKIILATDKQEEKRIP
jgi:nitrogen fixation NifU-like protein